MEDPATNKLDQVYGIARQAVPLTYVSRSKVDDRFLNEITRDQHIVIYGSSKQGKTSLLLTALRPEDYVAVQCAIDWSKEAVYRAILKEVGVSVARDANEVGVGDPRSPGRDQVRGGRADLRQS